LTHGRIKKNAADGSNGASEFLSLTPVIYGHSEASRVG